MKRYEKLILLVVALLIVSKVGGMARDVYLAQTYGPGPLPPEARKAWELISFIVVSGLNIGIAFWVYLEAAKRKLTAWVWALLGLFFGLLGLAVFYLVQIYQETRSHGIDSQTEA